MQDYVHLAKDFGFTDAALLPVADLVVVPAYRCFCEENLCGNYDVLPVCPPMSGTVEEIDGQHAPLSDGTRPHDRDDARNCYTDQGRAEGRQTRAEHPHRTAHGPDARRRADRSSDDGRRPWKTASCMSAYCVDAQKMADAVHMKCWENDGKIRYFSLILFGQA